MSDDGRTRSRSAVAFQTPWFFRSLAIRLVVLVVVFLTVPILIYDQFRAADREKSELLLRDAQVQGELIARSLTQVLQTANSAVPAEIVEDLSQFINSDARVRLLLRRANVPGAHGF